MRRFRIGRSDANEIVIVDASVSRHHAELVELGGGRFSLKDLGSTFGTHVWQDQAWVPAAETEIRADTVIRFGEFRTTLVEVLGEKNRGVLGMPAPAAMPPAPTAPPPVPAEAAPPQAAPPQPATPPLATPTAVPEPPTPPPAPAAQPPRPTAGAAPPRAAGRPRRSVPERRRLAMRLGLIGFASFFLFAIVAVVIVLTLGDANPPARREDPNAAAAIENQRKFLAACTQQWNVDERRCRCFLAAAGPYLQRDDYESFADIVEAYLSGDSVRAESVLGQITEKRGIPASTRLASAFKGVVRDCQESARPEQPPQR